jgi:hypothetical protein
MTDNSQEYKREVAMEVIFTAFRLKDDPIKFTAFISKNKTYFKNVSKEFIEIILKNSKNSKNNNKRENENLDDPNVPIFPELN